MTSSTDLVYRINKKPLPILLLSTVAILAGSTLLYGQASYQTPLNVGTSSPQPINPVNFTPLMMTIPLGLGALISLGMFMGLRHASNHPFKIPKIPKLKQSVTTEAVSVPQLSPAAPETDNSSETVSSPPEEVSVEPSGNSGLDKIDMILQSLREKDERERENTGGESAGSSQ